MPVIRRLALALVCAVLSACVAGGPSASPSLAEPTALPPAGASVSASPTASPSPIATATATPGPTPTSIPPTPRPTPAPTPSPPTVDTGFLNYGQWADVLVTNLRVRTDHELDAPIIAVVQPGDRLFPIDSGAEHDKDLLYYWYYVAYGASVNANGYVVAEGLGWVSGGPTNASPYGGPPGPTYINWAEWACPSLPLDSQTREHMTEWAMGTCGIH